jgi:hypothetical protein
VHLRVQPIHPGSRRRLRSAVCAPRRSIPVPGQSGSDAGVSPGRPSGRLASAFNLIPFRIGVRQPD